MDSFPHTKGVEPYMKANRICALLLLISILFAGVPALAAPTRDTRRADITIDQNAQTLLEITAEAAFGPDWASVLDGRMPRDYASLENGAPVSDLIAQRAAACYMARMSEKDELTREEAESLIQGIYTNGQWTMEKETGEGLITLTGDTLSLNRDALNQDFALGVYPYSAEFDGEQVLVKADLYACPMEYAAPVDELPEDMVIWISHMEYTLKNAPEAMFGYTVSGYQLSPLYLDGDLTAWITEENTDYEYSLNLPYSLGLASEDPAHRVWQSADGQVTLKIDVAEESLSLQDALQNFMAQRPEANPAMEEEWNRFYAVLPGSYTLVTVSENLNWAYTLTLSFPAERQAEYELYAEFIRNSFSIWGISNG